MENNKEIRNTTHQVTVDEEKRTVEGRAILYNVSSDGLDFEEIIERGALEGVLEKSDVFAFLNHSQGRGVLARWKGGKGSLELIADDKGLLYRFESPKTALGDELLENLRRGEIDESSFAFTVEKDTWEKKADGTWKRTIHKIGKLYDISPVYNAAYSSTSVYMRGKEEAEAELESKETRGNSADLEEYWKNIENQFNF